MDEKVLHLVKSYILEHIDKADKLPHFEVFTVWKAEVFDFQHPAGWYVLRDHLQQGQKGMVPRRLQEVRKPVYPRIKRAFERRTT